MGLANLELANINYLLFIEHLRPKRNFSVEDHLATEHDSEARCVLGEYSAQEGTATN